MDEERKDQTIEPELQRYFTALNEIPTRNPEKAARSREKYLEVVNSLGAPVSDGGKQRHKGWIGSFLFSIRRKESKMLSTLSAVFLAIIVLFGGSGATALAAQDSLPDDVLYPVKTFVEDLRLDLTGDLSEKVDLLGEYTNRRMYEISAMVGEGKEVPERTINRYRYQMNLLLGCTAQMEKDELPKTLKKVHEWVRDRDRVMDRTMKMDGTPDSVDPNLETMREMIQAQNRILDEALEEPLQFQLRFQHRGNQEVEDIMEPENGNLLDELDEPVDGEQPGEGESNGPGPSAEGENKSEDGYGPGQFEGDPPGESGDGGTGDGPGSPPDDNGGESGSGKKP